MWSVITKTRTNTPKIYLSLIPRWGSADAEINVLSVENPELSKVLSLKHGVGQIIASPASSAARNCAFLISALPIHPTSFFFSSFFCSRLRTLSDVRREQ